MRPQPKPTVHPYMAIPGWLTESEGLRLEALASECTSGEVVEIGAFKGRSTAFLAKGCTQSNRVVHSIDHFRGSSEMRKDGINPISEVVNDRSYASAFVETLMDFGLCGQVIAYISDSQSLALFWQRNIEVLFIDAEHTYAGVKADFDAWSRFVMHGGFVCFHDYADANWPGVKKFVDEITGYVRVGVTDTMMVMMRS